MKKIAFIIGGFAEVYTLKEIQKIDDLSFDKDFFYLIRALEKNPLFTKAVENARKKFNLPSNGYDWQDRENIEMFPNDEYIDKELLERKFELQELYQRIEKESFRIYKDLKLGKDMKQALPDIILSNCVYTTGPAIYVETDDDIGSYPERVEAVLIRIQKKVSKNQLRRFIDENWDRISGEIKHLTPFSRAYISERDALIIKLRDKDGMTYKEIADEIIKRFKIDDSNARINEDSVKTAYKRAKNRIASLVKVG